MHPETGKNDVLAVKNNAVILQFSGEHVYLVEQPNWHCFDEKSNYIGCAGAVEANSTNWMLGIMSSMHGKLGLLQIIIPSDDGKVSRLLQLKMVELAT